MSTNAIQQTKTPTLRQQLSSDYFKQQVALALPKHMTPDRFIRVGLTALMKTPKLLECTQESVLQCMLACSTLGLEPDGRRAHLIPYGTTCTLIVDYKGIVELAKRSGDVAGVFAQIVCENDKFKWDTGEITHEIDFRHGRGEMYAAYAIITFKDGSKQCDVMTREEIDAIRNRSRAAKSGPWVTDYNEMAKKTVFRRASKWITLSPEVADAFEKDDGAQFSAIVQDAPLSPQKLFGAPAQDATIEAQAQVVDDVPMDGPTPLAKPDPKDEPPMGMGSVVQAPFAKPETKLAPKPEPKAEETPAQLAKRMVLEAYVPMDMFIADVTARNISQNADTWPDFDAVPEVVWTILGTQQKALATMIRKFGKKKE